jgi:hypothetical protein
MNKLFARHVLGVRRVQQGIRASRGLSFPLTGQRGGARPLVAAVSLLLSLLALGCEADPAASNDVEDASVSADAMPDASVPADAAVDPISTAFATLICRVSAECGLSNYDEAICLKEAVDLVDEQVAHLQALVANGRLRLDRAALDACLAQPITCRTIDPRLLPCPAAFEGSSGEDDECIRSEQCSAGQCWPRAGERCGTCRPLSEAGEPCLPGGCVAGTMCSAGRDDQVCKPKDLPEGAPCDEGICAQGLTCGNGMPRVCEATAGLGEPCEDRRCGPNLACGPDRRCAEYRWGDEGSDCMDGRTFCRSHLVCDDILGRCVVPPGPNEPCVASTCAEGAYCDETTCRPKLTIGSPCEGDKQCASPSTCIEEHCAVPPPPPADCGPTFSSP